eukprot:gene1720-33128_t
MLQDTDIMEQAIQKRETHGALPVMSATLPNRMEMVLRHRAVAKARDAENSINQSSQGRIASTLLAPFTHGVAPQALAGLEPIVLSEAVQEVNMIHAGRVMFLTIVEDALRTVATSVIVRDTEGDMMTLHLYNYVPAEVLPWTLLPVGTHIALVEPYLRFPLDDEQQPVCMRCDNPQAVHVLSERRYEQCTVHSDFEWTEEQELCQQGNLEFSSGHFLEAMSLYNKALRTASPEDPARARYLCNRAQCHARKGRWSAALADSEEVLRMDPTYMKSAYCRALALLMLQRPLEARKAAAQPLIDILTTDGETFAATEVSALQADIERGVREQESGAYDLQALLKESESGVGDASPGCISRRHCDYESPLLKMVEGSGAKGRCIVAEKAIPAGTLLMAAKAIVFEPANTQSDDVRYSEKHSVHGSNARMLPRVVQAILDIPESSSELYTLSAGPAFGDQPLPGYTGAVDVPRIRGILCNNWTGTGLWIRPSLFNHSCLPNSTNFNVADFMFISTTRDVEAGEELSLLYIYPMEPFEGRTKRLAQWNGKGNGFACDCARCGACRRHPEIASLESEAETMHYRVRELWARMPMPTAIMGIVKAQFPSLCLGALERFPDREVCGVLLKTLELEAMAQALSGEPDKAVPIFQRLIDIHASALGTFGNARYVSNNIRLASTAIRVGNQSTARQSMLAAFKVACVPGWHGLPISLPDFRFLIWMECLGYGTDEDRFLYLFDSCVQVAVQADAAMGHVAGQKPPAFCAYCAEGAPNMLRCGRCGELYCSREHQKAHWKIHKKVCK